MYEKNDKYHKLLEKNYHLRQIIDNYEEIFDRKDRVHNKLNHDYIVLRNKVKKLETKVKRKYYRNMPKEVREDLKTILKSLENSCRLDEVEGVDKLEFGDPLKDRYHDLFICAQNLREIL